MSCFIDSKQPVIVNFESPMSNVRWTHLGSGSLVGGGTSQSLGTRFWIPVLRYLKVICNFNCIWFSFRKYYITFFFNVIFCSAVIVLVGFKMYIISYNSVQNDLAYFYMSVYIHVCNAMMYTKTRL